MTGMENFNVQSKRTGAPINTSTSNAGSMAADSQLVGDSRTISTKSNMLEAMKGNKKGTPGGANNLKGPPHAVGQGSFNGGAASKNPGTAGMDQREKKIYEIYASGKSSMGPIGSGPGQFNQQQAPN